MKAGTKSHSKHSIPPPAIAKREHSFGRPRDGRVDTEVVSAVLNALRGSGYGAVTIDGIARKVKRARTTIYRRWPSKRRLVAYAVVSEMGENPAADTGIPREDLEAAVGTLLNAFGGPLGQALPGLVADRAQDAELAETIRSEVLMARRRSMREAFARARARGETRTDLDVELVLDMLTGPFLLPHPFRACTHHPADDSRCRRLFVASGCPNGRPEQLSRGSLTRFSH